MVLLALFALVFLVCLSAFFSGSETILFSLTPVQRSRIRSRSAAAADAIEACLNDSAALLSTLLVGNTFVNFAIATIGYWLFTRLSPAWGGVLAVPVMTIFLLFFGEITPKRLALLYAEELAPITARVLRFFAVLLKPFNLVFRASTQAFSSAVERERRALSDAELVSVLEVAAERGDFAAEDAEMIAGVLRLSELRVNDEMTPRIDIEGIDIDYPEDVQASRRRALRHQYAPVFRRTPDAIEGVYCRATGVTEDALFVHEQMPLDDLLVIFRKSGKRLAVATDEYGGTAGIITLDDVMEIIMGPKVFDRTDLEPQILKTGAQTWVIDARASLEEVNRELGLELEADDADRLAGWVAFHAERIPHVGQEIEAGGCRATVLRRRGRRVASVKLEVLAYPETGTDAELIAETDEQVEKTEEENA